jgi:coenzyme F420 hydrogenase subunit delta
MEDCSYLPEYCSKETLILCCGNRLFGDDGFGPEVADYLLSHYQIPSNVYVGDAGTGVRKLLFTLYLSDRKPVQLILVDAVDKGRTPGAIFDIELDEVPLEKSDDFSLHQVPSSNLAKSLQQAGVSVCVKVCQVQNIPDHIEPGLTPVMQDAVPRMCRAIAQQFFEAGKEA